MKSSAGTPMVVSTATVQRMFFRTPFRITRCAITILLASWTGSFAADWQATLSKEPVGNFPELRPLRASYRFGWSGVTAATGEIHFSKPSNDRFQLEGTGRTIGFVRALWKLDVTQRAAANSQTLAPIETEQSESYRSKKIVTHLTFTNSRVIRTRTEDQGDNTETKSKQFAFPNLFDLHSAALYPATNAYLAIIKVTGRDRISVHAGTYNAIKLDLQLKRIGKHLELEPHKKFRRATIWVSDDAERLILRIEAQIFVGTVFAELQSMHFDNTNQR
jgi:Protein of unknown function (DUF3108)